MVLFKPGTELRQIVNAVNEIGASPTSLISILEALKSAGAGARRRENTWGGYDSGRDDTNFDSFTARITAA